MMHTLLICVVMLMNQLLSTLLLDQCVQLENESAELERQRLKFEIADKCIDAASIQFISVSAKQDGRRKALCYFSHLNESTCASSYPTKYCTCNRNQAKYVVQWNQTSDYSQAVWNFSVKLKSGSTIEELVDMRKLQLNVRSKESRQTFFATSTILTENTTIRHRDLRASFPSVERNVISAETGTTDPDRGGNIDLKVQTADQSTVIYIALGCIFFLFVLTLFFGITLHRKVSFAARQYVFPAAGKDSTEATVPQQAYVGDIRVQCEDVPSVSSDTYDAINDDISSKTDDLSRSLSTDLAMDLDRQSDGYTRPIASDSETGESSVSSTPKGSRVALPATKFECMKTEHDVYLNPVLSHFQGLKFQTNIEEFAALVPAVNTPLT